jgi:hypothetical protein
MNVCFECRRVVINFCPKCQTSTLMGKAFKLPTTLLAWKGAMEFAQMDETFRSTRLTLLRIRRFVAAMESKACREYLRKWPCWYRQFTYLAEHPEMIP